MSSDDTDFIDREYQAPTRMPVKDPPPSSSIPSSVSSSPFSSAMQRPPSREELESKVSQAQQKLSDLRRAQEELERERVALEESRRRRAELQTGRDEMLQHLTRGIVTLEEVELASRQETEQLCKTLTGLRDALAKVKAIQEDHWTTESYTQELARALTWVDNARMEWNTALIKWPRLGGTSPVPTSAPGTVSPAVPHAVGAGFGLESVTQQSFWQLTRIGLAFTWPLVTAGAIIAILLGVLLSRR